MKQMYRLRYVTFEEQHVAGSARPKIVPVYHLGKSLYPSAEECLQANLKWLAAKTTANAERGQQVTRFEVIAIHTNVEEQPV